MYDAIPAAHKELIPDNFEPLAKKVTKSIEHEQLDASGADVDQEQPPVPPSPWSGPQL